MYDGATNRAIFGVPVHLLNPFALLDFKVGIPMLKLRPDVEREEKVGRHLLHTTPASLAA
jgi:hypothetical protein